ncbi:MAG: hypothetical protein HUN05_00220 [Desulfobacter sp.]|nr:MAG: hypothetical protein HUN05_00220 [Desulfobacter sp.]
MIKWVRGVTIILALAALGAGVFFWDAEKELRQAYQAYKHQDMDQAMRHARRAIVAAKKGEKIINSALKLEYAIRHNHPEKAMDYLDQAIVLQPFCGLCYLQRGDLNYRQKKFSVALHDFKKGFENSGQIKLMIQAYYYARQGLSHLKVGEYKKAATDSWNARRADPKSPLAFFLESKVRDKHGDLDGAYENAQKGYGLGSKKRGFFSSPEGDLWLRYYVDIRIRHKAAHR